VGLNSLGDIYSGGLVFACIFGAAALAMWLHRMLPEHHLSSETKDTVKITMALVATMTAMILGLLVSSARGTYEAEKQLLNSMSAKIVFLDRALVLYGAEGAPARKAVYDTTELMRHRYWPETDKNPAQLVPETRSADEVHREIHALAPQTDEQRELKEQAVKLSYEIGQLRWLILQQSGSSVSTPLLVFVICWLSFLFFSFGLFAPSNGTVLAAMFVSTLSVASAVFLILELDQPFDGLVKISSDPLVNVLTMMGSPADPGAGMP